MGPALLEGIGFGTFIVFGAFALTSLVVAVWLPETKGVMLEHIDQVFDSKFGIDKTDTSSSARDATMLGKQVSDSDENAVETLPMKGHRDRVICFEREIAAKKVDA